jgi:signal transduction histidine kinase
MSPRDAGPSISRRCLGLPPRVALGFAAALVALVAAGSFSSAALSAQGASSRLVSEAAQTALAIEEVESALLVAHTALDAYLGARDPAHRQRHQRATAKLAPTVGELARLAGRFAAAERDVVERIAPEVATLRAEHDEVLARADGGDLAGARALRGELRGTEALERAMVSLDLLELHVGRLADERQGAWARSVRSSNAVFLLAHAALLVLILLAARRVREEIRAREENEAAHERALAVQRRLMAIVSHDLRNPLTGVLAAGWSLSRAELPREQAVLARRIMVAGRRMERLIRDLLDWSRFQGGAGIPVTVCEADLHDVCRRIADEHADRQAARIQLTRAGDTRAIFDPDRMEQVVANLLGNALKYAPPETAVHVRAVGEEDEVRLEVRDEGPGLPPEVRSELFAPFNRGRGAVDETSLGLGLFIVRTLAEAQGATVEVESAPGRGTSFVVKLRRARAAPAGPVVHRIA